MRHQIYFTVTIFLRLEMSPQLYFYLIQWQRSSDTKNSFPSQDRRAMGTAPRGTCCTMGCNHGLFSMKLCQQVCKSIYGCLRTFYNKSNSKDTGLWIKSIQEPNFPLIIYVVLATPLKARDTCCRLQIGGENVQVQLFSANYIPCTVLSTLLLSC